MILSGANLTATYSALTEGDTSRPRLGFRKALGGKIYKFVQYKVNRFGREAVAAKSPTTTPRAALPAGSTTAVTSDLSDSAGLGAGVLQSAPANDEYCWIKIKGHATLALALTAGADGNALTAVELNRRRA